MAINYARLAMQRNPPKCTTRLMIACCLVVTWANGVDADSEAGLPLDVDPAPKVEPLPATWQQSRQVYAEDLEHAADGAYPGRWRFRTTQWLIDDNPAAFLRVRRLGGGGQVLQVMGPHGRERSFWCDLPWDEKRIGGQLRVQLDAQALDPEHAGLWLRVMDVREPVAYGYPASEEGGPMLRVQWPDGSWWAGNWERREDLLPDSGKLQAHRWYRITVIANMDDNQFDLFVDDERVAQDVPFADFRWFQGADQLSIGATHILLDNIAVHHLPPTGRPPSKTEDEDIKAPPRSIPAKRLLTAPKIDGRVDEAAWQDAYYIDRFYLTTGEPWPAEQPRIECWLGYRDDALYVATRVWPKKVPGQELWTFTMDELLAQYKQRPAQFGWTALDVMQLYIYPLPDQHPNRFIQLGYNFGGFAGQQQSGGRRWHGQWQAVVHHGADYWSAEVRIPWVELAAGTGLGDTVGFRLYRSVSGYSGLEPSATLPLARLTGLNMSEIAPPTCQLDLPEPVFTGDVPARVSLFHDQRHLAAGRYDVQLVAFDQDGAKLQHRQAFEVGRPERRRTITVPFQISTPGGYHFRAIIRYAGLGTEPDQVPEAPLVKSAHLYAPVLPHGDLEARTNFNYYTYETTARLRVTRLGAPVPRGSSVQIQVRGADNAPLMDKSDTVVTGSPFLVELPLIGLPLGKLKVHLRLLDAEQTVLAESTVPLIRRPAKHNEVKIRWDNVMIVNGRPFFPVFIFNSDPPLAHYLGANTLLCTAAYLHKYKLWEECRRFGIYLIARDW